MSQIRRGFLIGGFCMVVAAVLHKWPQSDPIDILSKRLRALFPEIVAAAPTLRGISELAPLRENRTALADSIFSPVVTAINSAAPEIMDFLVRAVDRDFADGQLVVIQGWTLSQTEVRLFAFIAADGK